MTWTAEWDRTAELPNIRTKAHQKYQGFVASSSIRKITKIALEMLQHSLQECLQTYQLLLGGIN